jgi:hypothetical protein
MSRESRGAEAPLLHRIRGPGPPLVSHCSASSAPSENLVPVRLLSAHRAAICSAMTLGSRTRAGLVLGVDRDLGHRVADSDRVADAPSGERGSKTPHSPLAPARCAGLYVSAWPTKEPPELLDPRPAAQGRRRTTPPPGWPVVHEYVQVAVTWPSSRCSSCGGHRRRRCEPRHVMTRFLNA